MKCAEVSRSSGKRLEQVNHPSPDFRLWPSKVRAWASGVLPLPFLSPGRGGPRESFSFCDTAGFFVLGSMTWQEMLAAPGSPGMPHGVLWAPQASFWSGVVIRAQVSWVSFWWNRAGRNGRSVPLEQIAGPSSPKQGP